VSSRPSWRSLSDTTRKAPDGGKHPAFSTVDLGDVFALSHRTALAFARKVEVLRERISRVAIFRGIAIAGSATAAAVPITNIAAVAVIGRSRIVSVPHCCSSQLARSLLLKVVAEQFEYEQTRAESAIRIRGV
jgi:hypothetical protein